MKSILALGSNLEDPATQIQHAATYLDTIPEIKVLRQSSSLISAPYGVTEQPDFANCLVEIETELEPLQLLNLLKHCETHLGRLTSYRWGPRLIDIDIIFIEDKIVNHENLIVPHYDLHNREYLLTLLNDFCPDYIHPTMQKSIQTIYHEYCTLGGV